MRSPVVVRVLVVVGAVLAALGLIAGHFNRELLDGPTFADHVDEIRQRRGRRAPSSAGRSPTSSCAPIPTSWRSDRSSSRSPPRWPAATCCRPDSSGCRGDPPRPHGERCRLDRPASRRHGGRGHRRAGRGGAGACPRHLRRLGDLGLDRRPGIRRDDDRHRPRPRGVGLAAPRARPRLLRLPPSPSHRTRWRTAATVGRALMWAAGAVGVVLVVGGFIVRRLDDDTLGGALARWRGTSWCGRCDGLLRCWRRSGWRRCSPATRRRRWCSPRHAARVRDGLLRPKSTVGVVGRAVVAVVLGVAAIADPLGLIEPLIVVAGVLLVLFAVTEIARVAAASRAEAVEQPAGCRADRTATGCDRRGRAGWSGGHRRRRVARPPWS